MIDDSAPEYREVENSVNKLKNAKCQGTDNIYAEQLKYSQSIGLINYIVLLMGLIWTSKKPLFIASVYLKAAYDWIPRDALFKCLEIRLKSPGLVSILRVYNTDTKAYVKGSKHLFDTMVGCRQGALESPTVFNIYMDFLVRVARHEVLKKRPDSGIKIEYSIPNEVSPREYRLRAPSRGTTQITELLYADDEATLATP